MAKDIYDIDPNEVDKFKKSNKSATSGTYCPKRNKELDGKCKACERVQQLFNTGDPKDRSIALDKMAKINYYISAVLPENKDTSIIIELGKKVGEQILKGIEIKGWNDLANPKSGKGRMMSITKSKGDLGFNTYDADRGDKADWDISKDVLDNLPNLIDSPIAAVEAAGDSILKISSLKLDETLHFRLCPWHKDASIKSPVGVIFRHWGVTQDEIDGVVEMDLTTAKERKDKEDQDKEVKEEAPWEDSPSENSPSEDSGESKEEETKEEVKEPKDEKPCFGEPNFYDKEDEECTKCAFFKKCGRAVANI